MMGLLHPGDETATSACPGSKRVSVVLVTYNHARFIARALDSILAQQTDFAFDVIISEDRSTDTTRDIIETYAARDPSRIQLLLSEKNLNSTHVVTRAIAAARGEYIALMDGDDYLLSPLKLQKQVDFLDSHPGHTLCYHNALIVDQIGNPTGALHVKPRAPVLSDLSSILAANPVPGSASMIRKEAVYPLPDWFERAPFGDWPLFILAAQNGLIGYIDEPLSAYRKHPGGHWSSRPRPTQYQTLLDWYDLLLESMPAHMGAEITACREHYRVHPWYVTEIGEGFRALLETGTRSPKGWCGRRLTLRLEACQAMPGFRVCLINPDFDASFARNRIEVHVGEEVAVRENLEPGQSLEVVFRRPLAAGGSIGLDVRCSVVRSLSGKGPPHHGFGLLGVEPLRAGD